MPNRIWSGHKRSSDVVLLWTAMIVTLLCAVASGRRADAQQPATQTSSQAIRLLPRSTGETPTVVDTGDLIQIQVFNTPELSGSRRVDNDGAISLPGTGDIKVAGLTPLQAGNLIEKRLRDSEVMLDPKVSVTIAEFSTLGVTVVGEVKNPGTYPLMGPQPLYAALAAAGGTTPKQGPTITITHHADREHPQVIRANTANFSEEEQRATVQPGDIVLVSQAGAIYVVGDVYHPGEYYLTLGQPIRVLNAVALAQGMRETAAATHASIIRSHGEVAETIPIDLKKIEHNQSLDPVLEPSDIVVIPRSGFKQFVNIALPSATGAAANAASLALLYH